jgi:hypothetical protein
VEVVGFNEYKNPFDGLRKVYQLEGVKGFVSGGLSTVMREGPFSGIYYLIYKSMKSYTQVYKIYVKYVKSNTFLNLEYNLQLYFLG